MRLVLVLLLAAVLAPGCEQDVDLQGHIELGDLVRLDLPADESLGSIGLIDGWVLILSYRAVAAPPPEWGPSAIDLYVRWLSPENVLGEPIYAGRSLGTYRSPRWVRDGDVLTGPLWATWDPSGPPGDARTYIRMPSYRPGETMAACESTPELPVAVDPDQGALIWWTARPAGSGREGSEPAALSRAGVAAFAAIHPAHCSGPLARTGATTLGLSVQSCSAATTLLTWGSDACWPRAVDDAVASLWALELPDAVGLLVRSNEPGQPTSLVRVAVDLGGAHPPRTVGRLAHGTEGVGGQPRGAVAGDRILLSEREAYEQYCHLVRTAALDGADARDAAWQLPCWRNRVNRDFVDMPARLQPFLELHSVTEAAALVFVDAPNFRLSDPDQSVAIIALALSGEGRRASEFVDLAPADAVPVAFVRTTSAGDTLAAAYFDEAPGREGYWLRRFAYIPDPR